MKGSPDNWVSSARNIANEYGQDQVIIVTFEKATGNVHVSTYGASLDDSENAAKGGDFVKKALGWPDQLCHSTPPRVRTLIKAIKQAIRVIEDWHMLGELDSTEKQRKIAWNIYLTQSPEMQPIRDALKILGEEAA